MIKIINYTLMITIISIFSIVGTKDLSAYTTKKCVCPAVKTIKNQKYICKLSPDGRCICKTASMKKTKNKAKTKTSHNKTTTQAKKVSAKQKNIKSTPKKVITPVSITKSSQKPEAKKSVNPLIIVNRFEEDPTFLASITGILYGINENINIIDVANINETKDIILQSYKLLKTSSMWGENAVFISGSNKAKIESTIIIVKSKNNQFFVTQNSGVITFIKDTVGISKVRKLQRVNFKSKTLNGRDVEYLIGAKLIDNPANFDKMGEPIEINQLNKFNYTPLKSSQQNISSLFVLEDKDNGNIFTFIPSEEFNKFNPQDNDVFKIILSNSANILLEEEAIYKNSRTYFDGTEAIILGYKSSIGTYMAIKNIQNNGLSTLANNDKNYKISITPVHKGESVDISNIENTGIIIQNENTSLDEEKSRSVPYSTKRTTTTDILIEENINQSPTEANIKDLQKSKKSIDNEITSKDLYPNAGRNNLSVEPEKINIDKEYVAEEQKSEEIDISDEEIEEIDISENQEYEMKNDQNTLDSMIDKDLSNEATSKNNNIKDGIKGISSTNSYIDEEDGVLLSKLASNNTKKTLSQDEINSLEAEKAIKSNNSISDDLLNQNSKDIQRDNQNIKKIKETASRGSLSDSDTHVDRNSEELVTGIRRN